MSIIEKFSDISTFMGELFDFVKSDQVISLDFNEYLKTLAVNNPSQSALESYMLSYIFERRLDGKTIFELYDNETVNKGLLLSLKNSVGGYFLIQKLTQNGFKLYNLLNEKTYDVISLVKMTNFRGVYQGQYVKARIFYYENTYYLLEISDIYSKDAKDEIYRFLIATMIQEPECVYINNSDKEQIIKEHANQITQLFKTIFGSNEIITTNDKADELLNMINDNFEHNEITQIDTSQFIVTSSQYKYFKVSEFTSDYNNFLENSLNGFSSHKDTYDVGMVVHEEYGLYILPFWGTINKILQVNNLTEIEGASECLKYYMENDKIPLFVIELLNAKYKNFLNLINTVLETHYNIDELTDTYKKIYKDVKVYSPTSVLYTSKVFLEEMGLWETNTQKTNNKTNYKNIGRNDPCPCGSGKKYKNCCLNN